MKLHNDDIKISHQIHAVLIINSSISPTVFRRINAPGAEAENEPLALSNFDETNGVDF